MLIIFWLLLTAIFFQASDEIWPTCSMLSGSAAAKQALTSWAAIIFCWMSMDLLYALFRLAPATRFRDISKPCFLQIKSMQSGLQRAQCCKASKELYCRQTSRNFLHDSDSTTDKGTLLLFSYKSCANISLNVSLPWLRKRTLYKNFEQSQALLSHRWQYALLFSLGTNTMRSFFGQKHHMQVFRFILAIFRIFAWTRGDAHEAGVGRYDRTQFNNLGPFNQLFYCLHTDCLRLSQSSSEATISSSLLRKT